MTTASIVSKVWSFCNPLRDVGVGYGDYLKQLTYLLFLKMADEYSKPPHNKKLPIPKCAIHSSQCTDQKLQKNFVSAIHLTTKSMAPLELPN